MLLMHADDAADQPAIGTENLKTRADVIPMYQDPSPVRQRRQAE